MKRLLALLMLFVLSGCWWAGPAFYVSDPSAPAPFLPGRYHYTEGSDETMRQMRISRLADGRVVFVGGGKPSPATFVPLDMPGRSLWIAQLEVDGGTPSDMAYTLAERQADGLIVLTILMCAGSDTIIRAAGGQIAGSPDTMSGISCRFPTRAALETALRAYAAAHPTLDPAMRFIRLGD